MAKQKMIDLLYELMKDSKRSDRELAKFVGVSSRQ
jgi:DNA-binding Lrp family transcriptional regulator